MLKVMVVDGQGGGMGRLIIERLRAAFTDKIKITAVGTNTAATGAMLKAGANESATGENAVIVNARHADIITGTVGIIAADSMLGELSPAMAHAVTSSEAVKVLIPVNRCNLLIAGTGDISLAALLEDMVAAVGKML